MLNEFGKIISKNIVPPQFSMKNRLFLIEFAKERLLYLRYFCQDNDMENSLKYLSLFAFEALFLDSDDFKLDNLKKIRFIQSHY